MNVMVMHIHMYVCRHTYWCSTHLKCKDAIESLDWALTGLSVPSLGRQYSLRWLGQWWACWFHFLDARNASGPSSASNVAVWCVSPANTSAYVRTHSCTYVHTPSVMVALKHKSNLTLHLINLPSLTLVQHVT